MGELIVVAVLLVVVVARHALLLGDRQKETSRAEDALIECDRLRAQLTAAQAPAAQARITELERIVSDGHRYHVSLNDQLTHQVAEGQRLRDVLRRLLHAACPDNPLICDRPAHAEAARALVDPVPGEEK